MGKEYWQKLQDPRWQKKRLEVMNEAEFSCSNCGDTEKTLNVHHIIYRKNTEPWDYQNELLKCLCEDCHKEWHEERLEFQENLAIIEAESLGIEEIYWLSIGLTFKSISALEAVKSAVESRIRNLEKDAK